jgi:CheY-like chemotaxis protein
VLLNLLSNAIKYSDAVRHVVVRAFRRDAELGLQVEDHGIGIDQAEQRRIFVEFYRVETPLSSQRGGVGPGLTLVRRLAEAHGGGASAWRARVARGPGSRSGCLWNPRLSAGRRRRAPGSRRQVVADRILLIEDDRAILDGLRTALSAEGYEVECAQDGSTGLARAHAAAPALLILDVMLPGMGGFEVAKRLRDEGYATPILLLTRGEEDDRVLGLELGADDYVTKPFSLRELLARVRSMPSRRALSPRVPDPRVFHRPRWRDAVPGAAAPGDLGLRRIPHHANRGQPHPPSSQEDRGRARVAAPHPDPTRGRLRVRAQRSRAKRNHQFCRADTWL